MFSVVVKVWKSRGLIWRGWGWQSSCDHAHIMCWDSKWGTQHYTTAGRMQGFKMPAPTLHYTWWTPVHENVKVFVFHHFFRHDLFWEQFPKSGAPESSWNFHSGKFQCHWHVCLAFMKEERIKSQMEPLREKLKPPSPYPYHIINSLKSSFSG